MTSVQESVGRAGGEGDGITEYGSQSIKYNCEVLFSFSFFMQIKMTRLFFPMKYIIQKDCSSLHNPSSRNESIISCRDYL